MLIECDITSAIAFVMYFYVCILFARLIVLKI